ncbi:sensor histidine kinase [Jiulongibacter sediminis]|uniref:sensor histidine kinase n=1 Tax=Jiulongibacter sediminis TaxID=1605367 RepID=UPI00103EC134|nr:histidine kinase [Jiulongibacter sediminis]
MNKTFTYLKKHWMLILSVITALLLFCFYQQIYSSGAFLTSLEKFSAGPPVKALPENASQNGYRIGFFLVSFITILIKNWLGFLGLISLSIVLSKLHYAYIFKELFVGGGTVGKLSYLLVIVLFFVFLTLGIKVTLPKEIRAFQVHFWAAVLLIGIMVLTSILKYVNQSHRQLRDLSYQKTKAELNALKAQINPHFLFNVLNNLYGQAIVEDSPKTAAGIENLSRIMRHVVEETKTSRSPMEKELQFLNDYLHLQQMRIPDRPNISIKSEVYFDQREETKIAPLILIPFIENAFKYGISMNEKSFIDLKLHIENNQLNFDLSNSIHSTNDLEKGTGTGLENTRKRLQLHYPDRHLLSVNAENGVYNVKLQMDL